MSNRLLPNVEHYFPEGTFAGGYPERDQFIQEWYASHLASMNEPRLFQYTGNTLTAYRFLYLPTFEAPSIIRITRTPSGTRLITKRTDGKGGYEPGKVVFHETAPLTTSQWRRLERALSGSRFWSLPACEPWVAGVDGNEYVVEGYDRNHDHVVDRWEGGATAFRNLCDRFVELCSEATGALSEPRA